MKHSTHIIRALILPSMIKAQVKLFWDFRSQGRKGETGEEKRYVLEEMPPSSRGLLSKTAISLLLPKHVLSVSAPVSSLQAWDAAWSFHALDLQTGSCLLTSFARPQLKFPMQPERPQVRGPQSPCGHWALCYMLHPREFFPTG